MKHLPRLLHAEALATLVGRRAGVVLALAIAGSVVAGLVAGALLAQLEAGDGETAVAIVSRGSAAQLAITVFASLSIAGPYRDGSWMQSALALPSAALRLLVSVLLVLLVASAVAVVADGAAVAGAAAFAKAGPSALLRAVAVSLFASGIWAVWMAGLAHATRAPMLVLAVGVGLPLLLEPGLASALSLTEVEQVRWLLPTTALRALSEGYVEDPVMLAPVGTEAIGLAIAAVLSWTALAVAAAWIRMRGAQPR